MEVLEVLGGLEGLLLGVCIYAPRGQRPWRISFRISLRHLEHRVHSVRFSPGGFAKKELRKWVGARRIQAVGNKRSRTTHPGWDWTGADQTGRDAKKHKKHTKNNTAYVFCKKFLELNPKDRHNLVQRKKFCFQCLDGKTKFHDRNHQCSDAWVCKDQFHEGYNRKLHFLVCDQHKDNELNKELYGQFKEAVLSADWQKRLHSSIYYCIRQSTTATENLVQEESVSPSAYATFNSSEEVIDACAYGTPAYVLQPVPLQGKVYNLMFDNGCQKFVVRNKAIDSLPETHKENTRRGPIVIGGVGNSLVTSQYGEYAIKLPSFDKKLIKFTGICLDVITGPMPPYPVREASKDIVDDYVAKGGKKFELPDRPANHKPGAISIGVPVIL